MKFTCWPETKIDTYKSKYSAAVAVLDKQKRVSLDIFYDIFLRLGEVDKLQVHLSNDNLIEWLLGKSVIVLSTYDDMEDRASFFMGIF